MLINEFGWEEYVDENHLCVSFFTNATSVMTEMSEHLHGPSGCCLRQLKRANSLLWNERFCWWGQRWSKISKFHKIHAYLNFLSSVSVSVKFSSAHYFYHLHSCLLYSWWWGVKGLLLPSQIVNWHNCIAMGGNYGATNNGNFLILTAEHREQYKSHGVVLHKHGRGSTNFARGYWASCT